MAKAMDSAFHAAAIHNQALVDNCYESISRAAKCERALMQKSCFEPLFGGSPYQPDYAQQACIWNTMWLSDVQQNFNKFNQQKVIERELQLTSRAFEKISMQQFDSEDDVFNGGCSPNDCFSRGESTNGKHSFYSFDRAPGGSRRSAVGNMSQDYFLSENKPGIPHPVNHDRTPPNNKQDSTNRKLERQSSTNSSDDSLLNQRRAMQRRINQAPASVSSGCIDGSPSVARMLSFGDHSPSHGLSTFNHSYNMAAATEALPEAAEQNRHLAEFSVPMCTWEGTLPAGFCINPVYSCKVFLGGVPWDITADDLQVAFSAFGSIKVEFPNNSHGNGHSRHQSHTKQCRQDSAQCFGYVYVIFEDDQHVKSMLQACTKGEYAHHDEYYFKVSSRKITNKEVQVIPWLLGNSNYVAELCHSQTLNSETTIFVGALHGMLNAEGLALVMNELFGNVSYAGIDTDKHKYPIGSGRVTFTSSTSYMKAVNAAFVEIKTPKFVKKVQIDPYLEETLCKRCRESSGPYFCRNLECFTYFCHPCWNLHHNQVDPSTGVHKPLCRNLKNVLKNSINTLMVMDPRRVKPQ